MTKRQRGTLTDHRKPTWAPLLDLGPDEAPDFMWMFRVELEDGTVVEAYKHSQTRRYLHLDAAGRAYVSVGRARYEEADPVILLLEVAAPPLDIVRQNEWFDGKRITWARSATRHRIPRARTRFVIEHAGICFEDGVGKKGEPRLYFFGDDEQGRPLEIVAIEGGGRRLLVIHSMLLRRRFETRYKEALKWGRRT